MKILGALQMNIKLLEDWVAQKKKPDITAAIDIEAETVSCYVCGKRMRVQKTITRKITTLQHNSFNTYERVLECPAKCKYPSGLYVTHRATETNRLAPIGSNYGYDLEIYVGMERFVEHRQRDEIQKALKEKYSISISSGEISVLANRFLAHIEELHKNSSVEIRSALLSDGGYPLHIDCTTEGGKGTLLVIYAGWRNWVLGSWKIPTEAAATIEPCILEVSQAFGEPLAVMRDLGQPIACAIESATAKMSSRPKILACHFHFLRDVGKGILSGDYDHLRNLIRKLSIRDSIRKAVRATRKKSYPGDMDYFHTWFDHWLEVDKYPVLPGGLWGISLVISLGQWILDYSNDGRSLGFPFDCPYHNLYKRCQTAVKAIDYFLADVRFDHDVNKELERLKNAVSPLLESKEARKTVRDLEKRIELFDKIRGVFRFESEVIKSDSPNNIKSKIVGMPWSKDSDITAYEQFEKDMLNQVGVFVKNLRKQYEDKRTNADLRHAIKIILTRLDKHGKFLWGHSLIVQIESVCVVRLVDRTNNALESFFRQMKHGERRRSGRKILTRDFENIPAAAALATNLTDPDYIKVVCGSLDNLPDCFSKIDQKNRELFLNTPESEQLTDFLFNNHSLINSTDKSFIRRASVNAWLLAASNDKPVSMRRSNEVESDVYIAFAPFEDIERFLVKSTSC